MQILESGDYITKNGRRVTIDRITDKEKATANCKGTVWRLFRGKARPRGYEIWCDSGKFLFIGDHNLDIVAKYNGQNFDENGFLVLTE
jgi:hypothetical protein